MVPRGVVNSLNSCSFRTFETTSSALHRDGAVMVHRDGAVLVHSDGAVMVQ